MSSFIEIITSDPRIMYSSMQDVYGGKQVNLKFDSEFVRLIEWLKLYKQSIDEEIELRKNNPALSSQYEAYKAMLNIVRES